MSKQVFLLILGLICLINSGVWGQKKSNDTIRIKTSAVCGMCKSRIENNMAYEKGVRDIVLDLETKTAIIAYNGSKTTPDELRKAISKLGYDADNVAADTVAYRRLPACCKKDAPPH
jgi:copper chaperone CopZ